MGIYNVLKRVSNGITDQQWQEVYQETLIALEKYPFADKVLAKSYLEKKYYQVHYAKERNLAPLHDGKGYMY